MKTQTALIYAHLRDHDGLTSLEALDLYGCFRLAARIADIKALGYTIETETVTRNGKRYARYHLVEARLVDRGETVGMGLA